jgi:uncharacterized protein YfaS (alpha-2-macroglobulin family)
VHGYLKESGQLTPELEARLKQAHTTGLQRIVSFESEGGGFGWYGGRGAEPALTAYGLLYLADLSRVFDFDRGVMDRAVAYLERAQDGAGGWPSAVGKLAGGGGADARFAATAYVAWALRKAGKDDTRALGRAEEYLKAADTGDPYALALIGLAFPWKPTLDALAKAVKDGGWTTRQETWTRARGDAAYVETTALAVLALEKHAPELADRGAEWLVQRKGPYGAWGSTQATVLALQALAAAGGAPRGPVSGRLWVNGKEIPGAFPGGDGPQSVDVSSHLVPGRNEVVIESSDRVNGQVSGRCYVPWSTDDLLRQVDGLNLNVSYDRSEARVGDVVTCTVKVEADGFMVIAEVAVPPGFTVDSASLDDLVRRKVVDKVGQDGRKLVFYLPGKSATFGYPLRPRYPAQVSVPRSVAYEYYTPDRRVISPPQDLKTTE